MNTLEQEEMILVPKATWESLLKDADWLLCLEAAGVDNWSGYDEARRMLREGVE